MRASGIKPFYQALQSPLVTVMVISKMLPTEPNQLPHPPPPTPQSSTRMHPAVLHNSIPFHYPRSLLSQGQPHNGPPAETTPGSTPMLCAVPAPDAAVRGAGPVAACVVAAVEGSRSRGVAAAEVALRRGVWAEVDAAAGPSRGLWGLWVAGRWRLWVGGVVV